MTLVLAGAIGGKCSITTADTRRVHGTYWEDENTGEWGTLDSYQRTNLIVSKVGKLTNFVTYAQCGNSDISEYIIELLKRRVSRNSGVLRVGLQLQEVIAEMRKKKESGAQVPFFYNFLDSPDNGGFGIVLNGFTNEIMKGKSYFCFYISGYDEEVSAQEVEDGEYKYIMWAPDEAYARKKIEYMGIKFNSDENQIKTLTNHFVKVHAVISSLQPKEVSELCEYQVLKWMGPKEKPSIESEQVDLSLYYKDLNLE